MMADKENLPDPIKKYVRSIGKPVTTEEIDAHAKLQEAKDRSLHLRSVVKAWKDQKTQDRGLRTKYANCLLVVLIFQVVVINVLFILLGSGCIEVEAWTGRIFIMSVFAEISALTLIVVKYLFPTDADRILMLLGPPDGERRRRRRNRRKQQRDGH